jgi:hypothetical protein
MMGDGCGCLGMLGCLLGRRVWVSRSHAPAWECIVRRVGKLACPPEWLCGEITC